MLTRLIPILVAAFLAGAIWLGVEALWFAPIAFLLPSCSCCVTTVACTAVTDSFTGTTITGWTQVSGTWSQSGTLTTSSTSAIIINNTSPPVSSGVVQVKVASPDGTTRSKLRIIGAYTDSSNYLYAELDIEKNSIFLEANATLSLYEMSGGTPTLLETASQNRSEDCTANGGCIAFTSVVTMKLCWHAGNVSCSIYEASPTTNWTVTGQHSQTGTGHGLGTGSAATGIVYDDYSFNSNAYDDASYSAHCTDCTSCRDSCSDGLPASLDVTLPSDFGDNTCACGTDLNGQTFTLNPLTDIKVCAFTKVPNRLPCVYEYNYQMACNAYLSIMAYFDLTGITVAISIATTPYSPPGTRCGSVGTQAVWKTSALTAYSTCAGGSWSAAYVSKTGWNGGGALCDLATTPGNVGIAA